MSLPINIMTSYDVIRFSPVPFALTTEAIQRQIPLVENEVFNSILGRAWRAELVADIADYSAVQPWEADSYDAGDLVSRGGVIWIATATTATEPAAGAVGWDYAPRFDTECNNLVYNDSLGRYLALCILQGCLTFIAIEVNSNGVVRKKGENFDPAILKELDRYATAWDAWKSKALSNLHYYVTDNADGCTFPLYEGDRSAEVLACCPLLRDRWNDTTTTKNFSKPRYRVGGDNQEIANEPFNYRYIP